MLRFRMQMGLQMNSERSFEDVKSRLDEIVEEISQEGISLDDALSLYEEAVKLGLEACDLSESDILNESTESDVLSESDSGEGDAV